MTRLLAFDLDGTLLDEEKLVPDRSTELVERLRGHGCVISVITGRASVPRNVMQAMRPDATAVNNGGRVRVGRETVAEHLLDPHEVETVLRYVPGGARVAVFQDRTLYVSDHENPEYLQWDSSRTVHPLARVSGERVDKVLVWHPECAALREQLTPYEHLTLTGAVDPYPDSLSITPLDANKGNALRDIARALSVPIERTVAFGDSDNDLAMFQVAGVAVQVGEAECLNGAAHHRVSCATLGLPGWLENLAVELARELA